MNYCSLEDAWGNDFSESRKNKKPKKLYTLKKQPHIYDTSMSESHDKHCSNENKRTFTIKNKNRYQKSRTPRDIYRPKRSSRVDNINISYDDAKKEYRRYKKESRNILKKKKEDLDLLEEDINNREYVNNYSEEKGDYDLIPEINLPEGRDMSNEYNFQDPENIQREMYELQKKQNEELEKQQELLQEQMNKENKVNSMASPEYFQGEFNYNNIEGFTNNNLDNNNLVNNEIKQKVKDVDEDSNSDSDSDEELELNKFNKKQFKNGNILDKLLENKNDNDSDTELEEDNIVGSPGTDENIKYKLNNLNRNVNLIIKKLSDSNFFEDESQENIHDIILFILFGIFILFVLDTIYKFGTKKNIQPTLEN